MASLPRGVVASGVLLEPEPIEVLGASLAAGALAEELLELLAEGGTGRVVAEDALGWGWPLPGWGLLGWPLLDVPDATLLLAGVSAVVLAASLLIAAGSGSVFSALVQAARQPLAAAAMPPKVHPSARQFRGVRRCLRCAAIFSASVFLGGQTDWPCCSIFRGVVAFALSIARGWTIPA
jgi:hypothetical protein